LKRYATDFSKRNHYGQVYAHIAHVGDKVSLVDVDGNTCIGTVIAVQDGSLIVLPDYDTWWSDGEDPPKEAIGQPL
jgi:hypothetical protein